MSDDFTPAPSRRELILEPPDQPFLELPKIPSCFCLYPLIYSVTWDLKGKAWHWRFDCFAKIDGVPIQFKIPAPIAADGKPEPLTLDNFIRVLQGFVNSISEARDKVRAAERAAGNAEPEKKL